MDEKKTAIEELDLSVRAWRNLKRSGIDTVEQLLELMKKDRWGKKICFGSRAVVAEIAGKLEEAELLDFASTVRCSGYEESAIRSYQELHMQSTYDECFFEGEL